MSTHIVPTELYIRRLRVDEALYLLDQYLNDAFMAGHLWVRIVHGKGTGTLRDAVWEQLGAHPLVSSHRLGDPGEGDAGVTVVQMEQR